jgi:hypothetical protein
MPTLPRLIELGAVPAVAREIIGQFANTLARDPQRFIEHGVPAPLARELTTQAAGTKSAPRLIEFGMPPELAREVVN